MHVRCRANGRGVGRQRTNTLSSNAKSSPSRRHRPASKNAIEKKSSKSELNCPHFDQCSGCTLEDNLASPPVLARAKSFFKSQGFSDFDIVQPPLLTQWRHRARLAVRRDPKNKDNVCVGLFQAGSHYPVDIPLCRVHHPLLNTIIDIVREWIIQCEIEPYDEISGTGELRYIQLAIVEPPGDLQLQPSEEVQLVLVWNSNSITPEITRYSEILWNKNIQSSLIHSIHANFQPLKNNVILGPDTVLLHGFSESWTEYSLNCHPHDDHRNHTDSNAVQLSISSHPNSFMQANPSAMTVALETMSPWIPRGSHVIDLHAGVGTIGLAMAAMRDISSLRAVEINPSAQANFWKSWEKLKAFSPGRIDIDLNNCRIEYCVGAAGADPENWIKGGTVVIVDPPRKGLEPDLLRFFCYIDKNPDFEGLRRILYLSCGYNAFEMDCRSLLDSGVWSLASAQCFLFFPGSDHIETLAVFDRKADSKNAVF